jgi:hypothetical protein
MAENLENQFSNFSIENTMEMGMGNSELLQDLLAPETASSNPDDIKKINDESQEIKTDTKKPVDDKSTQDKSTQDKSKEESSKSIEQFLLASDEDAEETKQSSSADPTNDDKEKEKKADDDVEVTQFGALANDLFKLGVFSKDEDEESINITSAEEFLERFQAEKKKGAIEVVNNFIGQFGEDYQQAFDAIFVKGVNPKEYFNTYNQITNFSELDLSQEINQVAVLKQALSDQGFESEDVVTEIERLKNYGDLESVAAKHHKVLIKKEASKLQQMEVQAEKELQQKQAIKHQYVNNVQNVLQEKLKTKEFDGIPINPKLAAEIQDFLLVDKYKTNSGETLTDFDKTILELKRPENHEMKVKVGLILKILEKDPTLSTIQKSGISKKSNELFGEVARQVSKSSIKSSLNNNVKPNTWFI